MRTVNGIRKIEERAPDPVRFQLRGILQEHRKTLVDKLLDGGIEFYIDYKFNVKATHIQLKEIREQLMVLKDAEIDAKKYQPVFETVLHNENTTLDNRLFYAEIDLTIKSVLDQSKLFKEDLRISYE